MNKYPCGLIEDLIPLYIEGDISNDTKEIVQEHLRECGNCNSLMNEFSNDDLKLEEFKEDLPQADTFKRWMKRLKIWGSAAVILIVIIAAAAGVIGYELGKEPQNDLLSLKTITKTIEKQGIVLKKDSSKNTVDYDIDGVKPSVYSVGDKKGTLLIYTFKSFVEREAKVEKANKFNKPFSIEQYSFNAKNAFIVYIVPQNLLTMEGMESLSGTITLLSDTVFKSLNDGKEIVYKGQSSSWQGTFTLKYYEHWWEDETGTLNYESYNIHYPVIKYKMPDPETVGPTEFEYKTDVGISGKITGEEPNKDGYLRGGSGGGSGAFPREKDAITFIIKWKDKEESIVLKAE